jgi:hypothetical protein
MREVEFLKKRDIESNIKFTDLCSPDYKPEEHGGVCVCVCVLVNICVLVRHSRRGQGTCQRVNAPWYGAGVSFETGMRAIHAVLPDGSTIQGE